MASRLCTEEVTKPVPLPAWALPADAAAGRVVGTPPEQKLRTKSYELVPPWAVESDTGPPQSAGRGSRGTRLEEAALKAQEVARNVEAASHLDLKKIKANPHVIIPQGLTSRRTPRTPKQVELPAWQEGALAPDRAAELTRAGQLATSSLEAAEQARRLLKQKELELSPRVGAPWTDMDL
ncbi:unnamed protein product [Effrenium voratum]|uniref:Uncharacterized protein n=1 Tax=Effrenium voratum TaxID=2562239 RepID=A0AA36MZ32_9DINO|nr:unnamed protein product [Effrenium voratum]